MAERKAVNKYYPPDWDPRKGSVNKRVGQHPLRDRAKKLSQGILVIRFELPYNIWCGGCGSHVGMGVRYNAEKSKVGNYYSTPIYKFRMKCHLCDNYFEIQTDPKNHDYVILCGARRKEQRWDPVANEQIVPEDKATQKKMSMDAMYKLEHGSDDKTRGKEKVKNLAELESSRFSMKEDYLLNRMARDKFRAEKKQLREAADAERSIVERGALDIDLLEETEEDRNLAGLLKYSVTSSYEEKQKEKRKSIEQRPLFNTPKSSSTHLTDTPSSSSSSDNQESNEITKQKLSETIRLAQKDPFAIVKPVKVFGASSSKPSVLGIRLKHSKVTKACKGKPNFSKKAVISHLQTDPSSSFFKKFKNNVDCVPSTQGRLSSNPGDSLVVSKVDGMLPTHRQLESISNSMQTKSSSTSMSNEQFQTHKFDVTSDTQQAFDYDQKCKATAESTDIITSISTNEECDSSSFSTQDKPHSSLGLSILMSSYDEDRDSDSCGSS